MTSFFNTPTEITKCTMHTSFYLSNRERCYSWSTFFSLSKCFLHLLNPKDGKSLKDHRIELHPRENEYLGRTEPELRPWKKGRCCPLWRGSIKKGRPSPRGLWNCQKLTVTAPSLGPSLPKELFQCFLFIPWNKCLFSCLLLKKRKTLWLF